MNPFCSAYSACTAMPRMIAPRGVNVGWATIPRMDFQLTEQQELIRKEVATLARSFSLDYWLEQDRKAEYPWDWVKTFAQAGWLGMIIPEEYGGSGLGVHEEPSRRHGVRAAGRRPCGAAR